VTGEVNSIDPPRMLRSEGVDGQAVDPPTLIELTGSDTNWASLYNMLTSVELLPAEAAASETPTASSTATGTATPSVTPAP
jgi:hypothetical protein